MKSNYEVGTALTQILREQNERGRSRLSVETLAVMDGATKTLADSGISESCLGPGEVAPAFTLPDVVGEPLSLGGLIAKGPVVLSFYRGGWCPYCSTQFRALQSALSDIRDVGAELVAISPQTPDNTLSTAEKLELTFPVLSDLGNNVAKSFGLVFTLPEDLRSVYEGFGLDIPAANGDDTFQLPIPATFVIDRDGIVAWRFADPDYTKRADPIEVLEVLSKL